MAYPVADAAHGVAAGSIVDLNFNAAGVAFPFHKVRSRMFIRVCWAFFVHVLVNAFALLDPINPNNPTNRPTQHWVVSGTPGIGTRNHI